MEWKECVLGVERPEFELCSGRDTPFLPPHQFGKQLPVLPTVRPAWTKDPKDGGGAGRGREARAEGQDRERMQGNAPSHGCRQWEYPGPGRVEWDREPEVGRETGWKQPTLATWESWQWDR